MSELNTLEDIPRMICGELYCGYDAEDLRAEAVKWANHYKAEGDKTDNVVEATANYRVFVAFIKFFNLSEDDL